MVLIEEKLFENQIDKENDMPKNKVIFSAEEFEFLYSDLIKISRSFDDGLDCGYQELKIVIENLRKKEEDKQAYAQVVKY